MLRMQIPTTVVVCILHFAWDGNPDVSDYKYATPRGMDAVYGVEIGTHFRVRKSESVRAKRMINQISPQAIKTQVIFEL